MKNLLNSKDLLAEPRVKAAAKAMGIRLHKVEIVSRCCPGHNELVMKSLADVAFEMRDACDTDRWEWHLVESFFHSEQLSFAGAARKALRNSTAEQQIVAATLAYREGQK